MAGTYIDTLRCVVGDLPVQRFGVRVGVVGSPVHVQTAAHFIPGLFEHAQRRTQIPFGAAPKGVSVTKHFTARNLCCYPVQLELRVRAYQTERSGRHVSVQLACKADGTVALAVKCVTSMCALLRIKNANVHAHLWLCCIDDKLQRCMKHSCHLHKGAGNE